MSNTFIYLDRNANMNDSEIHLLGMTKESAGTIDIVREDVHFVATACVGLRGHDKSRERKVTEHYPNWPTVVQQRKLYRAALAVCKAQSFK